MSLLDFQQTNEANKIMKKFKASELTLKSFPDMKNKKGDDYEDDILKSLGYDLIPRELITKYKKEISKIKFGRTEWRNYDITRIIPSKSPRAYIEDVYSVISGKGYSFENHVFQDPDNISFKDTRAEIEKYYADPKHKKILDKQLKSLSKYPEYMQRFRDNLKNRAQANLGITWTAIKDGFRWIEHYRSGSARKIDKSVFPFLKAITVNKKRLPKTVYRGYFISGEKVDAKQSYKVGEDIKLKNSKATSWSTSKGLALEFSIAQDMVKDRDNGYQIVVSYDIQSEEDVIADFRTLPGMAFYNQQELLISQKVKIGRIVYIKQGNEYKDNLKNTNARFIKSGDSARGETLGDYARNISNLNKTNLDINDKIFMKQIFNMTTAEAIKMFPELINNQNINLKQIGKLKAILGLQFLGAADYVTVRNENVMIFKNANVYISKDIMSIAKKIGIRWSGWAAPFEIVANATYKIVKSSYNNIEYVIILDRYEVVPSDSEPQTEENTTLYSTLRDDILSLPDNELKKFLPGVELEGKVSIRRPN